MYCRCVQLCVGEESQYLLCERLPHSLDRPSGSNPISYYQAHRHKIHIAVGINSLTFSHLYHFFLKLINSNLYINL